MTQSLTDLITLEPQFFGILEGEALVDQSCSDCGFEYKKPNSEDILYQSKIDGQVLKKGNNYCTECLDSSVLRMENSMRALVNGTKMPKYY